MNIHFWSSWDAIIHYYIYAPKKKLLLTPYRNANCRHIKWKNVHSKMYAVRCMCNNINANHHICIPQHAEHTQNNCRHIQSMRRQIIKAERFAYVAEDSQIAVVCCCCCCRWSVSVRIGVVSLAPVDFFLAQLKIEQIRSKSMSQRHKHHLFTLCSAWSACVCVIIWFNLRSNDAWVHLRQWFMAFHSDLCCAHTMAHENRNNIAETGTRTPTIHKFYSSHLFFDWMARTNDAG